MIGSRHRARRLAVPKPYISDVVYEVIEAGKAAALRDD
jgi:hypothetical protein